MHVYTQKGQHKSGPFRIDNWSLSHHSIHYKPAPIWNLWKIRYEAHFFCPFITQTTDVDWESGFYQRFCLISYVSLCLPMSSNFPYTFVFPLLLKIFMFMTSLIFCFCGFCLPFLVLQWLYQCICVFIVMFMSLSICSFVGPSVFFAWFPCLFGFLVPCFLVLLTQCFLCLVNGKWTVLVWRFSSLVDHS